MTSSLAKQRDHQLQNYVINERLTKIVEPANNLRPGQGGGR